MIIRYLDPKGKELFSVSIIVQPQGIIRTILLFTIGLRRLQNKGSKMGPQSRELQESRRI